MTPTRMILTNDDGIAAPGLEALERVCGSLGTVVVVAPDRCHSSMSHRVTTNSPIRVTEIEPGRFRTDGTPADSVRIAITCLSPDAQWIISGINRGGNLGSDLYLSGTVAAAREAALLGRNAVAISHYVAKGRTVDWTVAESRARSALARIFEEEQQPGAFWNVNLPHPPEGAPEPSLVFCPVDPSPLDVRFRKTEGEFHYVGEYHGRPRLPGHDVDRCFSGDITITRVGTGFL